jgi:hypothetical protein
LVAELRATSRKVGFVQDYLDRTPVDCPPRIK